MLNARVSFTFRTTRRRVCFTIRPFREESQWLLRANSPLLRVRSSRFRTEVVIASQTRAIWSRRLRPWKAKGIDLTGVTVWDEKTETQRVLR